MILRSSKGPKVSQSSRARACTTLNVNRNQFLTPPVCYTSKSRVYGCLSLCSRLLRTTISAMDRISNRRYAYLKLGVAQRWRGYCCYYYYIAVCVGESDVYAQHVKV